MVYKLFYFCLKKERAKAEKINRSLRQQLNDYRVPSVMEYVQEIASLYELRKKVKSWERKVEIAEVCSFVLTDLKILIRTSWTG